MQYNQHKKGMQEHFVVLNDDHVKKYDASLSDSYFLVVTGLWKKPQAATCSQ